MKNTWVLENWPRFKGCTLNTTPLHEFAQFLGCEPLHPRPTLVKPASLHEFTQLWGMFCTSSSPPLFTDLHTVYTFFIRTQFKKKIICDPPHPTLGSSPAYITISSLLLQLHNETRWAPSKSYYSRKIMTLS